MDLQDFITAFANQFDDTDPSLITATTIYRDLEEWSSLTALGVIAFIKLQYGKSITGSELRSCETVSDLYNIVLSK